MGYSVIVALIGLPIGYSVINRSFSAVNRPIVEAQGQNRLIVGDTILLRKSNRAQSRLTEAQKKNRKLWT